MHTRCSPSPQPTAAQLAGPGRIGRPAASEIVLVVDDGSADQAASLGTLEALGYRVMRAGNAQAALAVLESGTAVDVLMADEAVPRGLPSGELARQARRTHPGIALLITSPGSQDGAAHNALRAAGVELLGKPYLPDQLASSLRHLLANQQQVNALAHALRDARMRKGSHQRT